MCSFCVVCVCLVCYSLLVCFTVPSLHGCRDSLLGVLLVGCGTRVVVAWLLLSFSVGPSVLLVAVFLSFRVLVVRRCWGCLVVFLRFTTLSPYFFLRILNFY